MAFLIPSYFQKRLLRYALSRLDFLETDDLHLENLDISFGQRSVIELKEVGIQIKKLASNIPLPSFVHINSARIKVLRLTIPADLNRSGIEVEIAGVDVQVELKNDGRQNGSPGSQMRAGSVPSKNDKANRPRIASPQIYDPGGNHLPTSEGLAVSFLQSEPVEERQELQAAIQSQSQYLHESVASVSSATLDAGLGAPGGISLPGFVADFFQGIADRLSVSIKDVSLTTEVRLMQDDVAQQECVKVMVKVADLSLKGLRIDELQEWADKRREIEMHGLEIILLSDSDLLQPLSRVSSPKLNKSRLKSSSIASRISLNASDTLGSIENDLRRPTLHGSINHVSYSGLSSSSQASSDETPLFASNVGLGSDDLDPAHSPPANISGSMLSSAFDDAHSEQGYGSDSEFHEIDNRAHAENLARTNTLESVSANQHESQSEPDEDLAESRYFTHDEAESMYMSAVSGGGHKPPLSQAMPGGWDASLSDDSLHGPGGMVFGEGRETTVAEASPEGRPEPAVVDKAPSLPDQLHEGGEPKTPDPIPRNQKALDLVQLTAKRVFAIDNVSVKLPLPERDLTLSQALFPTQAPTSGQNRQTQAETLPASQLFDSYISTTAEQARQWSASGDIGQDREADMQNIELNFGNFAANVDLPMGRLLIKLCQQILQMQGEPDVVGSSPTAEKTPLFNINVANINFQICEIVSDLDVTKPVSASPAWSGSLSRSEDVLLELSFVQFSFLSTMQAGRLIQRLSMEKISIAHEKKPLLSCQEDVRKPFVRGGLTRRDDLTILIIPDPVATRVDVDLKPLHIRLDLLQIDDVLSRSGGLSSILDLGNSILSTGTVRGGPDKAPTPDTKQRSVRFEVSPGGVATKGMAPSSGLKLDVKVSGCVLDLMGSESAIRVQTSKLKAVYRPPNARISIDSVAISGPTTPENLGKGPITVSLEIVELEYLASPEEKDLDRLLSLLTPSRNGFDKDDDILIDTLLRQRRKGGVIRLNVNELQGCLVGHSWLSDLAKLTAELSKLSSVTKYLPEDDRPGILTFALVKRLRVNLDVDANFGPLKVQAELLEAAHVSVPSLMAAQVTTLSATHNKTEDLLAALPSTTESHTMPPMLMCRFIADEMEPTVRLKFTNTCIEYRVSTLITLMETLKEWDNSEANMAPPSPSSSGSEVSAKNARKTGISIHLKDSAIGLSPSAVASKALIVVSNASLANRPGRGKDTTATVDIKKASIMVIDDEAKINVEEENQHHQAYFDESDQIQHLARTGFIPVGNIAAASLSLKLAHNQANGDQSLDVEFRNNLFILETCADSMQTLIQIMSNLAPPTPPSKDLKYRTEVMPITDMLSSFTGNAFITSPGPEAGHRVTSDQLPQIGEDDQDDDETVATDEFFTAQYADEDDEEMAESYVDSDLSDSIMSGAVSIAPVGITESVVASTHEGIMAHSLLDFRDDHFDKRSTVGGTAHRWNSSQNTYGLANETDVRRSPLRVRVRDVHVIWNLFDGYDWQSTRDTISQAVKDIETKAAARRPRSNSRIPPGQEDDEESVIGDFLFNSIYIGVSSGNNPRDLTSAINHDIDDLVSETGSYATSTTVTPSPTRRQSTPRTRKPHLKLNRSKQHKMTFELKGVSADFLMFPPGSAEVESSIDVRVRDLEIFDHVPTSTWKKFATYMQDAGEREVDTNMVHLEILNVRPDPDLAISEMILKVSVLPLRLHVDQDALDFMSRFFEFKDEKTPVSSAPSTPPFLQRVEVNPVKLKLDFKPKRVDYGGIRSGRTTEFMNFIVLDRAEMTLRRVILYGVSGFDRLGIMLNNIWMPDVKRNQLPGILKSLAPVRPLFDVGGGLQQIVSVPMAEYRKDGRIVRSIQKGAVAFASTTAKELVNLGAKLAIGTQTILQNAEKTLAPGEAVVDEERKQISLYADQPIGIVQGLRGAWASLERDLLLAKDAIIAVPGEVMASGSATGAARAVLRSSPTIILRPAIGASKAVGQTLLGAGNAMDRSNLRRIDEKYKRNR